MGAFRKSAMPSGVVVITLDADRDANVLNLDTLVQLAAVLDEVSNDKTTAGLVLISGKVDFVAASDVDFLSALQNQPAVKALQAAEECKRVLDKLSALKMNTVAAIDGSCLAGGAELGLACKFRIATNSAKIGLAEVVLGLVPYCGGTIRLPQLIGSQQAQTLLTMGAVVDARKALKVGLIDEIVEKDQLQSRAESIALNGLTRAASAPESLSAAELAAKKEKAVTMITSKSKGFAAPVEAVKLIYAGLESCAEDASRAESEAFSALLHSEASRNLVGIALAQADAKRMPANFSPPAKMKIGVLGAGVMGAGIAQAAARAGYSVVMKDIKEEFLRNGINTITEIFNALVDKKELTRQEADEMLASVKPTVEYRDLAGCDLIVEAVLEVLSVKQDALAALERVIANPFIFATNTSSLAIADIGSAARDRSNIVGLHFFNPVHKMPLVELVRSPTSSDEAAAIAKCFALRLGKTPVTTGDAPGFAVNRVLTPYLREAIVLMQEGVPFERIDRAMKDFGMPMGPLELLDEIGLDVASKVLRILHGALGERMKPPALMVHIEDLKVLGRKGGIGIYKFDADGVRLSQLDEETKAKKFVYNPDVLAGVKASESALSEEEIADRLVLIMVNEAARALEQGAVSSAAQLDLAMVLGTGFPPMRGGLLRYADQVGLDTVHKKLQSMAQHHGANYAPAPLLSKLARGGKFYAPRSGDLVTQA